MPSRDQNALTSTDTLVASGARTANGDSGAWYGFGPIETLRVQLNVSAISGTTPSLTCLVEDSVDGTKWNTIGTFAAKTTVSREVINITSPFTDIIRVSWTLTGTGPSATFEVRAFCQGAMF